MRGAHAGKARFVCLRINTDEWRLADTFEQFMAQAAKSGAARIA